jgi:hypothetical protein
MTSIWLSVPISLIALAYYEKMKKPSGSLTPAQK